MKMRRHIPRKIIALVVVIVVGLSSVAAAQSLASDSTNSIIDHIWAGVRMATGTGEPSPTKPSTGTSKNTKVAATTYAALGDSVAAGLGLPAGSAATAADQACGRSSQGYPYNVAAQQKLRLIDAACSGAKAGDLFTKQAVSGPNITAQLDTAFAGGTPKLITVTAGANDAHWLEFLRACYASNCNTASTTTLANGYLKLLSLKLHAAMSGISERSNGSPPRVVFTGYYNPVSADCANRQTNVTSGELNWLSAEVSALNQTIKNAVSGYPNASFAPVDFSGHDICSSDPWIQGLNDPAPFHPTAQGQRQIASEILANL
jgi:lysophospholipase L1-like esterase